MAGRHTRVLILAAFMLSLLILLVGLFHRAAAQDVAESSAPQAGSSPSADSPVPVSDTGQPGASSEAPASVALGAKALTVSQSSPLVVPVYPLHSKKGALPKGADLRDSYVVLKDGSVMSVADWILGALKSDQGGVGMSDYENRLFLGQVARALVGQDEKLVDRTPVPQPVAGLAAAAGQAPFRIGPFTIDGSTVGGNRSLQSGAPRGITVLNDAIGTSFTDEISIGKTALLEDPYSTAFAGAVEDFKLHGTFMNMLHDYEKREPKGNNQGSK